MDSPICLDCSSKRSASAAWSLSGSCRDHLSTVPSICAPGSVLRSSARLKRASRSDALIHREREPATLSHDHVGLSGRKRQIASLGVDRMAPVLLVPLSDARGLEHLFDDLAK